MTYSQIQMILKERCDGNRNILHACVNMCSPTSNKETEQGNTYHTLYSNAVLSILDYLMSRMYVCSY